MTTIVLLDESGTPTRQSPSLGLGHRTERILYGSFFILALFGVWETVALLGVEPAIVLPSPQGVVDAFRSLFSSPDVWANFAASGQELLYGFALATLVGITAAL